MKKTFRILLWCLLGLIFVGTFYFLWRNSHTEPTRYQNIHASTGNLERTTVLTGKIEPRDEVNIKPQISGIVTAIEVEAGQTVRTGDIIARIQVVPDASQLSSAQSRLNTAIIELTNKRTVFQRDSALYAARVISREEYELSQRNLAVALEDKLAAEDALSIVRSGVSRLNAEESNTLVRATIDGLVLDVPVKVGTSVIQSNTFNDGTTIAVIADMNNLIFTGNVDETEVGALRVGMPVNITVGAVPELNPVGVIEYISPKGSNSTGANTFEIKAAMNVEPGSGLRAGYSANASVTLEGASNVLYLPESAVEFTADSCYVYVLADSTVTPALYTRTPIVTGISNGIDIEIKSGIDSTSVIRGEKIK